MELALKIARSWLAVFGLVAVACGFAAQFAGGAPADPWTAAQTVQPAQFAAELRLEKDPHPLVIYVGVRALFSGRHIPGAVYYGPGSTEQGINDLKKYAATLPKNSAVVLYCGCCPLEKCPNLRPAFSALNEKGVRAATGAVASDQFQCRLRGKKVIRCKRAAKFRRASCVKFWVAFVKASSFLVGASKRQQLRLSI